MVCGEHKVEVQAAKSTTGSTQWKKNKERNEYIALKENVKILFTDYNSWKQLQMWSHMEKKTNGEEWMRA